MSDQTRLPWPLLAGVAAALAAAVLMGVLWWVERAERKNFETALTETRTLLQRLQAEALALRADGRSLTRRLEELRNASGGNTGSEDLRDELARAHARARDLAREKEAQAKAIAELEERLRRRQREAENLTARLEAARNASAPSDARGEEREPRRRGGFRGGMRAMLEDPESRQTLRQAMQTRVMQGYDEFFRRVSLTDAEKEALAGLLVERRMARMENWSLRRENGGTEADAPAQTAGEEVDARIRALLGEDRYQAYEEYENTADERRRVQHVQEALIARDMPLDPQQRDQLLLLMKEVQPADDAEGDAGRGGLFRRLRSMEPTEAEAWMQAREQQDRLLLERARGILGAEQYDVFKTQQEQRANMMRMGIRMHQARQEAEANAPAPPSPAPPQPAE